MRGLKRSIEKYVESAAIVTLGADDKEELRVEQLRLDLQRTTKKNMSILWVCLAVALALFIVMAITVYRYLDEPDQLQLIFGATGVSFTGILWYVHQLWKEKNAADMLTVLIGILDPKDLKPILTVLLSKL